MKTAYVNGNIYTMKAEGDTCNAFVVEDGKFFYCGTDEAAKELADGEIVDLKGSTVLPGMIDTHQHLFAYARDLLKLNLKPATSFAKLLELIKEKADTTPDGQWIIGTGFDHEIFTDKKELPTKEDLDKVCPKNPLIITRYCLHVNVGNSLALQAGGIGPGFHPKVEGTVEFRSDGQPSGTLRDQAAADVIALIPDTLNTIQGKKDAIEQACHKLNSCGLTGVHPIQGLHCDLPEYTDVYQDLADEGRLTARVYLGYDCLPNCSIRTGLGDDMVKYGFYKLYTEQGLDGYPEGGWFPEERVSVYEALSMYTKNAAYASFEEEIKGTIEKGKLADFVILDKDVFHTEPHEIKNIKTEKTYLGGKLVYSRS